MRNEQDLINNKFYVATNYITDFFVTNLCFLLCISPLLIYKILLYGNSKVITLILSITIGPALSTLFSVMGKLIREGAISPFKDFFHFYKMNYLQGSAAALILNSIITILYFDIKYFSSIGHKVSMYLMILIMMSMILVGIHVYLILSRYNVKLLFLIKTAVILSIKNIRVNLTCCAVIIISLWLIRVTRISLVGLFFGASIICFLILKLQRVTIDKLENYIKETYTV